MSILGWVLAAIFGGLALWFARRPAEDPHAEGVERLTDEIERGEKVGDAAAGDTPEVLQLRLALARGWRPVASSTGDPGEEALRGLLRFVDGAVRRPLDEGLARGELRLAAEGAMNALKDLAFFGKGDRDEPFRTENLPAIVQSVAREYTLETGVPVKFSGPPGPVPVNLRSEAFRDALYLLFANAGRFGGGQTVDLLTEEEGSDVRLRVRDRGPGFSREALDRGFDPFWSQDADALGLGLTHARRVIEAHGGKVTLQNLEEGGAEVVVLLARAR